MSELLSVKTRWTDTVPEVPFPEYPRPQFQKESFINLNGSWDLAFTEGETRPERFDLKILVPFSPESLLSGVQRILKPTETLWYRRTVVTPENCEGHRVLLHFGAVDQTCEVFVNGKSVCRNEGGYYPFTADITAFLKTSEGDAEPENELLVKVKDVSDTDTFETGKQRLLRGGIWYTVQSGIWQTVWMEVVPEDYLEECVITPSLTAENVHFLFKKSRKETPVRVSLSFQGKKLTEMLTYSDELLLPVSEVHPWSPEHPVLYDVEIGYGTETIKSYFALRSFTIEKAKDGFRRFFLNGKPYYVNGLLDQGYYPDGLYTPASEEAWRFDIETSKALGFNTLRKHIKIEPLRFYYLCDTIGMLVFQDMINGGSHYSKWNTVGSGFLGKPIDDTRTKHLKGFGRADEAGRRRYYEGLERMIRHLYNVPSIVLWTPFNEGWGQFDAKAAYAFTKKKDPTRLVDHASGWQDQGIGELDSRHIYFRKIRVTKDPYKLNRAFFVSEFGGYSLLVKGHAVNEKKTFGYKKIKDSASLNSEVGRLFTDEILGNIRSGLCGSIYTQVSDVEDEINGIMTYDREVVKFDPETVGQVMEKIQKLYSEC